ncbi:DNA-binding transcriptional regulator YiaG [Allocatelliglobosispora scoriae]|uniref:DNA-binding transcriptional regulator YiaG n=1 Tax=Allocatelliglobosispora scoriae TaxID=643052 RepID=A0A841BV02_9ACTN|nr:hypothetical protein [Allocatelliglobosispora scoriae]MBB5870590.1 DNA-binding transcriptional regulator YiaG [Allocatelliglobosispora scoriae]
MDQEISTFDQDLTAVKATFLSAQEAVRAAPEPQQGFKQATDLAELMRDLADTAAGLRAEAVRRIWQSEKMSIAELADRIGVSKARADQLLKLTKDPTRIPLSSEE